MLGLSLGLTVTILAFLYVQNELKYDKGFTNIDNTYRLVGNHFLGEEYDCTNPAAFMPEIIKSVPEVISGVRVNNGNPNIKLDDKYFHVNEFSVVDSNFFTFFGWPLISGDPETVLNAPFKVAISESTAKELFGNENPIGKIICYEVEHPCTITGVFKDMNHTHLKADMLLSLSTMNTIGSNIFTSWGWFSTFTYLKTIPEINKEKIDNKLTKLWNEVLEGSNEAVRGENIFIKIQGFSDVWLNKKSSYLGHNARYGSINQVWGVGIIASVILLIVVFNYINLYTATLSRKAVEAGVHKTLGTTLLITLKRILTNSTLLLLSALVISILLANLLLSILNNFMATELKLQFYANVQLSLFLIVIIVLLSIITSIYPAIFFNKKAPLALIKKDDQKHGVHTYNKSLIIMQFAIATTIIISTLTVNKQLYFIQNQNFGYSKDNIFAVSCYYNGKERYALFKERISKFAGVKEVSCAQTVPSEGIGNWGNPEIAGYSDQNIPNCGFVSVADNFFTFLEGEIIIGRNFHPEEEADPNKVILSETAYNILGLENPLGKQLTGCWDGVEREIIGVAKNIIFESIHEKQKPVAFFNGHRNLNKENNILIKVNTANLPKLMSNIEATWEELFPKSPYTHFFLNDTFNRQYVKEVRTAKILNIMSGIAVFLCCIGLLGLSLFAVNAKIKEIGIRKVNGAKASHLILLLNKQFIIWVIVSFFLAAPLTYIIMQRWLESFAYHTQLNWWLFALTYVITLFITGFTVSLQSWKAASRNPVDALRYE